MAEGNEVTLDDLPAIDWAGPPINDLLTFCPRCVGVVLLARGAMRDHERWHAAIEDLSVTVQVEDGRLLSLDHGAVKLGGAVASAQPEQPDQIPDHATALAMALELTVNTPYAVLVDKAYGYRMKAGDCYRLHAGLSQGETDRLRRIEDALVAAGAPNRSEQGDPGGLVVAWIRRQADEMTRLRQSEKDAGRAIEALAERPTQDAYARATQASTERHAELVEALGLDQHTGWQDALDMARYYRAELDRRDASKGDATVATVDMRLALPDGWENEIMAAINSPAPASGAASAVVGLVREWATHVCEAHCTRHDDEPRADRPAEAVSPTVAGIIDAQHIEQDSDVLHVKIRQAIADPGRFVDRDKTWDPDWERWDYESVPNWGARAVMVVLNPTADEDEPADPEDVWCEICQDSFRHDDHYHCLKCKQRTGMMGHPDGCPEPAVERAVDVPERPAFLDAPGHTVIQFAYVPADSPQPCPSLYYRELDRKLYACNRPADQHAQTGSGPAGDVWHGWRAPDTSTEQGEHVPWTSEMAVPVPWPLDQEPPTGINTLRDTGSETDYLRYLCRVSGGWAWADNPAAPGGAYAIQDWDTVALDADGDLHVVRPQ